MLIPTRDSLISPFLEGTSKPSSSIPWREGETSFPFPHPSISLALFRLDG